MDSMIRTNGPRGIGMDTPVAWDRMVTQILDRLRARFQRSAAHAHAVGYVRGLMGDAERKNSWQLAEHAGHVHPRWMQRVLARYRWDADAVQSDVRAVVAETLGHADGVLILDESSFPKKGNHSCGVKRQYAGSVGKIANCQVGVFLGYASPRGRALMDRALYVPQEWFDATTRRARTEIPADVTFQTKPHIARTLVIRALDAGIPTAWVTADEAYGASYELRAALEERDTSYVLAVARNTCVSTWPPHGPMGRVRVDADVPDQWTRLSCGEGVQGPRIFDWWYRLPRPGLRTGWVHGLLIRRVPGQPDADAYFLVYCPDGTSVPAIVGAAGARWAIEDLFKAAKGRVGLDHYEARSWTAWHRHTTLAIIALLLLELGSKKGELAPI